LPDLPRAGASSGGNALAKPPGIHLPRPTASPILVGDRQTLQALRAAEMEAWNASAPAGSEVQTRITRSVVAPAPRLPEPERSGNDGWGLFILTLCAAAGVLVGMRDLSSFIAGWSRMMEGIRLLIQ